MTTLTHYWWGDKLSLDESTTQTVIKDLNSGLSIGNALGGFGSFVATLMQVGAAVLAYVDNLGGHRGVCIYLAGSRIAWVWYQ